MLDRLSTKALVAIIENAFDMQKDALMFVDELLHGMLPGCQKQYAFLILLNSMQDEFPWLYNMGKGLVDTLESQMSINRKRQAIDDCRRLIDFSFDYRRLRAPTKNAYISRRERTMMVRETLMHLLSDLEEEIINKEMVSPY